MNILKVEKLEIENALHSCLQGYYKTNYATLERVFGEPIDLNPTGQNYKVDVEWILKFTVDIGLDEPEEIVCTVYNWKTDGTPTNDYDWHIGGYDKSCVDVFAQYLEEQAVKIFVNDIDWRQNAQR